MFLFERLKNPNNKTPNIKKKKQKSYRWEMVWTCHSTAAPVCTQASCRQRCGRDQHGTHRPNAVQETTNPRVRNKGHQTPTTPHPSLTSNKKYRWDWCFRLILHYRWKLYVSLWHSKCC